MAAAYCHVRIVPTEAFLSISVRFLFITKAETTEELAADVAADVAAVNMAALAEVVDPEEV